MTLSEGMTMDRLPLRAITVSVLLAATIFALDLFLPLGVAGGVPYVALVLVGLWFPAPRAVLVLAGVGSVLTVAGYFLSEPAGVPWMVLVNRSLALFAIWIVAILGFQRRLGEIALSQSHSQLEDRVIRRTEALRESEERLDMALSAALMGTFSRELGNNGITWDARAEAIYGMAPGTFDGSVERFQSVVHSDDWARVKRAAEQAIGEGADYDIEYRAVWPGGAVHHVASRAGVIRDDDGTPLQITGVVRDITERKRLEAELLHAERMATLGRLSATVSHELRNPLGAIRTSLAVVEIKARAAGLDIERATARMERSIVRCDRIIEEMLDYARAGQLKTVPTEIDSWLGQVLDEQTVPDGISVRRDLAAPGAVLDIDPDRLQRAIINLYENACDAMAELDGEAPGGAARTLSVGSRDDGGEVVITIADEGPGMTDEVMANALEPLFSTKSFGVGLGLPIVKQIVEQHGGRIEFRTAPGDGTRATIRMPLGGGAGNAA